MNEPDRPRRDVSIEEAERMPMTDEELDSIDAAPPVERDVGLTAGRRVYLMEWERDALVAEVRRLRDEVDECPYKAWHPDEAMHTATAYLHSKARSIEEHLE